MKNMKITKIGIVFPVAANYTVEWKRCKTKDQILDWVLHFSEKTWMTPEMIGEFIHAAADHHNLDVMINA